MSVGTEQCTCVRTHVHAYVECDELATAYLIDRFL